MTRIPILFLSFFVLIISCSKDEEVKKGQYETGTFIVNEGPFGSGTGTISFLNGTEIKQDIFGAENDGNVLGNIAQSMIKVNDKYFIAVNNADKVQVVNSSDFKSVKEITDISYPRYFATAGNKLYLSSWNKDFATGAIKQIDPSSLTVTTTLPVTGLVERLLIKDDLLYITVTSNAFDVLPRHVLVLDTKTNAMIDTIAVGDNPNDIVTDKNGDIWVVCSGFSDWTDPTKNTSGSLHKINNRKSVQSYSLAHGAKGLTIDKAGDKLYYLADGKVWERTIAGAEKSVLSGNFYALGYDKSTEKLFLSDAADFQKAGTVTEIKVDLSSKTDFTAGIIPGFFYFVQ